MNLILINLTYSSSYPALASWPIFNEIKLVSHLCANKMQIILIDKFYQHSVIVEVIVLQKNDVMRKKTEFIWKMFSLPTATCCMWNNQGFKLLCAQYTHFPENKETFWRCRKERTFFARIRFVMMANFKIFFV